MQCYIAERYDDHIAEKNHSSERDVTIFVDDCGHNVRASGASVERESVSDAHSAEYCTDDTGHKWLVGQYRGVREKIAKRGHEHREQHHAINRFDAEFKA